MIIHDMTFSRPSGTIGAQPSISSSRLRSPCPVCFLIPEGFGNKRSIDPMKTRILSNKGFNSLWLALGLISLPDQVKAAENIVYNFNDAASASFTRWWGAAVQTYEFDATTDANNNPS